MLSFVAGGVWQVWDPNSGEVPQQHSAPRAHGVPPERRRAQRLHDALPHGPAGAQSLPLQSCGRDQSGSSHSQTQLQPLSFCDNMDIRAELQKKSPEKERIFAFCPTFWDLKATMRCSRVQTATQMNRWFLSLMLGSDWYDFSFFAGNGSCKWEKSVWHCGPHSLQRDHIPVLLHNTQSECLYLLIRLFRLLPGCVCKYIHCVFCVRV